MGPVDVGGDEVIGPGKIPFAFVPRKFAGGSINAHLLILSRVRLF